MTDWDALAESANEPDTLAKIVGDIRGEITLSIIEKVREPLRSYLIQEWAEIANRIEKVTHGDDGITDP